MQTSVAHGLLSKTVQTKKNLQSDGNLVLVLKSFFQFHLMKYRQLVVMVDRLKKQYKNAPETPNVC